MRKYFILYLLGLIFLVGCQTEPEQVKLLDELVVATNYDTNADFSSYSTFAIPTDTIGFFSNTSNDTIITQQDEDYPRPVIEKIKANMNARGYTQVDRTQNPDLGVNIVVVNDFDIFQQVVYPDYYGGGGYYSGYYGYNSWYGYPYVNTYAYNTGVLIIEIVDLKNRTSNNNVKVIWDAYLGDVYSTINLRTQTEKAIDQAFVQSPYLTR
jgi:hypothetical protein